MKKVYGRRVLSLPNKDNKKRCYPQVYVTGLFATKEWQYLKEEKGEEEEKKDIVSSMLDNKTPERDTSLNDSHIWFDTETEAEEALDKYIDEANHNGNTSSYQIGSGV